MNIPAMDKAEVLAALYNNARPQGMGFLRYDTTPMTTEEARTMLNEAGPRPCFDYVKGRVMKIDLSKDELRTALYNRDNGDGAAEAALARLVK